MEKFSPEYNIHARRLSLDTIRDAMCSLGYVPKLVLENKSTCYTHCFKRRKNNFMFRILNKETIWMRTDSRIPKQRYGYECVTSTYTPNQVYDYVKP